MFKQRLLTALVLVPLVLLVIYKAPIWMGGVLLALLVLLGAWEWSALIPIGLLRNKIGFIGLVLLSVGLLSDWFSYALILDLMLWLTILVAVLTFPASQPVWGRRWVVAGSCFILLPVLVSTCWALYITEDGPNWIVYVLCLVWATDIGAYLAGKRFGRHKLIPRVSPGKTLEGACAGFLLAEGVAWIGGLYVHPASWMYWMLLAAGTSLIAMLGDLFISMLKRRSQLKDTGQLFPGHGGLLDRVDSLLAALPFFYVGLLCLGRV